MRQIRGQMSETFFLGGLLTLTGGFLDAYTYVCRGGVFANAQTGNMVLLGLSLAQGRPALSLHYLIPVLAFALGVMVAELVRHAFRARPAIHWRQIIVAAEIMILVIVAFLPTGQWDTAANVLVSFLCAMQVESFRKINGNACATTMCTGNLRSGTELLFQALRTGNSGDRNRALQYFAILLIFICGAALGVLCSNYFQNRSVLFCCLLLAVAFAAMFVREKQEE